MYHKRRSTIREDRVRRVGIERDSGNLDRDFVGAVGLHCQIDRDIAVVMALRIINAVLLLVGVEVASGGLEVGSLAERFGVDVDGVFAGGQVFEVELDG